MVDVVTTLAAPAPLDGAPVRVPRPRLPWHQRLLQAVSAYLPLFIMALLALFTWWLVKNSPGADEPRAKKPVRHEPDYTMQTFTLQRYRADGGLEVQIKGAKLRHFPDTDMLEIDRVAVEATGERGALTRATARTASAKGDGSEVQLSGGARVVQQGGEHEYPPLEIEGETLLARPKDKQLSTTQPVRVRQGRSELQAHTLQVDHVKQIATLGGPIRMRVEVPLKETPGRSQVSLTPSGGLTPGVRSGGAVKETPGRSQVSLTPSGGLTPGVRSGGAQK